MTRHLSILLLGAALLMAAPLRGQTSVPLHLNRYGQEAVTGPVKVVFIGDSITDGWPKKHAAFFDGTGRLGRGISGETTASMVLRFRQDVVDHHPKYVVINGGTNDIALNIAYYDEDYTFGNIVTMVELARAAKIRPVLTSLLPASSFPWRRDISDAPEKIAALNARIKAYAAAHRIPYVDYHTPMLAPDGRSLNPAYSGDGVHPNADGYAVMESLLPRKLLR